VIHRPYSSGRFLLPSTPRKLASHVRPAYARAMIIHRQRPVSTLSLILVALLMVPFVLVGVWGAAVAAVVVWAIVVGVLVRRYKDRGKAYDRPPWVV